MRSTKREAFLGILLLVVVIGGGLYFFMQKSTPSQVTPENTTPIETPSTTEVTETETPTKPAATSQVPKETAQTVPADDMAMQLEAPYGCYAKTKTAIYDISGINVDINNDGSFKLPANAQKLVGADIATFKETVPYGVCFGMDKNNVYQGSTILSWAAPATFELLWYTKPGPVLFFGDGFSILKYTVTDRTTNVGDFSEVENGDGGSFEEMLGSYDFAPWAKDKNNVYCTGEILADADPATAKLINQGSQLQVRVKGSTKVFDSQCEIVKD